MRASRFIKQEAIVLHLRSYGDSHRIVELLTREHGRICVVARGARASKRRFAGALDLFVQLDTEIDTKGRFWSLRSVDIQNSRIGIRSGLESIARAR